MAKGIYNPPGRRQPETRQADPMGAAIQKVANRKVTIDGKKIPIFEALMRLLRAKSFEGDVRAQRKVAQILNSLPSQQVLSDEDVENSIDEFLRRFGLEHLLALHRELRDE